MRTFGSAWSPRFFDLITTLNLSRSMPAPWFRKSNSSISVNGTP